MTGSMRSYYICIMSNSACPLSPGLATKGDASADAAQDLVLDCPDAAHQLTLFLARAVADGVLPTSFLQSVLSSLSDASLGVSVVQSAGDGRLCAFPGILIGTGLGVSS